jgi:hypothetical protein
MYWHPQICCCVFLFGSSRQYFPWEIEECKILDVEMKGKQLAHVEQVDKNSTPYLAEESTDEDPRHGHPSITAVQDGNSPQPSAPAERLDLEEGHIESEPEPSLVGRAFSLFTGRSDPRVRDDEEAQRALEMRREFEEQREERERMRVLARDQRLYASRMSRTTVDSSPEGDGLPPPNPEGIVVSEAFSPDFSPSSSLVQISVSDDVVESEGDAHSIPEPGFINTISLHESDFVTGSVAGGSSYPESRLTRTWPTTVPSSVSRSSRRPVDTHHPIPGPIQPQLIPHNHDDLNHHRLIQSIPFSFDALPTAPPPPHLTGDRRAIAFMAPMTSVQPVSTPLQPFPNHCRAHAFFIRSALSLFGHIGRL